MVVDELLSKIILGTLNVNQLGVQIKIVNQSDVSINETVYNPNQVINNMLNKLINYIEKFFSTNSNKKILFLNEMKYERNDEHHLTKGYRDFESIMNKAGYTIIKNNVTGASHTVGFITLAITLNKNVSNTQDQPSRTPILSNYSNARYIELEYEGLILLGLHQDLKINKFPLANYAEQLKKMGKEFIIMSDLNVNKYKLKEINHNQYEEEYCNLMNKGVDDIFGNGALPTVQYGRRIDYALVSSNLLSNVMNIYQDNSTRIGDSAFTDHSFLKIELNIDDYNRH